MLGELDCDLCVSFVQISECGRIGVGGRTKPRLQKPTACIVLMVEEKRGWRVEIPYHAARQVWRYGLEEKPKGFQVIPRRWVVERTFAWMSRSRSLAQDYERDPSTIVVMMQLAMSRIMIRRLA